MRRFLLGLTGAVLLFGGGVALFGGPATPNAVSAAQARWAAAAPERYVLTIHENARCRHETEVLREQVVRVIATDGCAHPAGTVTELFALIAQTGDKTYRCVRLYCACGARVAPEVSYDPQRGYPARIVIQATPVNNYAAADFWRYAWRERALPNCGTPRSAVMVERASVQALP